MWRSDVYQLLPTWVYTLRVIIQFLASGICYLRTRLNSTTPTDNVCCNDSRYQFNALVSDSPAWPHTLASVGDTTSLKCSHKYHTVIIRTSYSIFKEDSLSVSFRHKTKTIWTSYCDVWTGRDSVVSIATRYKLGGPGIESWWRRDFQHPSRPALGPTQPPVQWVPGHSRG